MTPPTPYWHDPDTGSALYLGDMREILPALDLQADLVLADPPYAETSLAWDRWPNGWPTLAASVASSMWCFGSMRMFLDRRDEFTEWRLSQDVIWRKQQGTGFATDRFRRVHEVATHWYRGNWRDIHHESPRVAHYGGDAHHGHRGYGTATQHMSAIRDKQWEETGTRLAPSVMDVRNMHRSAIHPTQKPSGILQPLIEYACPSGGLVVDPFAGSGSTLDAARQSGRRAIGIEAHEPYAEAAARRLSALTLPAA